MSSLLYSFRKETSSRLVGTYFIAEEFRDRWTDKKNIHATIGKTCKNTESRRMVETINTRDVSLVTARRFVVAATNYYPTVLLLATPSRMATELNLFLIAWPSRG